jgi:hypothetical protein
VGGAWGGVGAGSAQPIVPAIVRAARTRGDRVMRAPGAEEGFTRFDNVVVLGPRVYFFRSLVTIF